MSAKLHLFYPAPSDPEDSTWGAEDISPLIMEASSVLLVGNLSSTSLSILTHANRHNYKITSACLFKQHTTGGLTERCSFSWYYQRGVACCSFIETVMDLPEVFRWNQHSQSWRHEKRIRAGWYNHPVEWATLWRASGTGGVNCPVTTQERLILVKIRFCEIQSKTIECQHLKHSAHCGEGMVKGSWLWQVSYGSSKIITLI